jgi:hypothetical protein
MAESTISKDITLSAPCTHDATISLDEIVSAIGPNLVPPSDSMSDGDLTRSMLAMQGVLVLASFIDVQLCVRPLPGWRFPESERPMVSELREAATKAYSLAHDLIAKRSIDAVEEFLLQYTDVIETAEYILQSLNQREAYRFGRMAEWKMTG